MTKEFPMTNYSIGNWGLGIPWTLGIGPWSLGPQSFQLVVFSRLALCLGDRIFLLHLVHLLEERFAQIDFQIVSQEQNRVQAIGQFVGDFGAALRHCLIELHALFPLEN